MALLRCNRRDSESVTVSVWSDRSIARSCMTMGFPSCGLHDSGSRGNLQFVLKIKDMERDIGCAVGGMRRAALQYQPNPGVNAMRIIGLICAVMLAGLLGGAPTQARAAGLDIFVELTPPASRRERVRPRAGYVWVNGHYQWRGNRYVWQPGYYERARRGAVYVQPRWVQQGNRWQYQRGNWRDDRRDNRRDNRRDRRNDRRR